MSRPSDRPYVILNAAMTIDGKIATRTRDSKISSPEDLKRVHKIRAEVDAIMVGINTLLIDDPKLTTKIEGARNPIRVIVDSKCQTPSTAQAVAYAKESRTIVATTEQAMKESIERLRIVGADVFIIGPGPEVDLRELLKILRNQGIQYLLLEGGGTLNYSMFKLGLIDEIRVAIAPVVVGGKDAITLAEGEGCDTIAGGVHLALQSVERYGVDLVLTYKVQGDIS